MHESLLVGVVQSLSNGSDDLGGFSVLEPVLLDLRGEVSSWDVFRNDIAGAIFHAADIMHRDDTWVIEVGDRASLGQIRFGIFRF